MEAGVTVGAQSALLLPDTVSGSFRLLFLYEVAEEIDLDLLGTVAGESGAWGRAAPAPGEPLWIQPERPPLSEFLEPLAGEARRRWDVLVKYYECGVITVELKTPFDLGWPELAASSAAHLRGSGLDGKAGRIAQGCIERARAALKKPYERLASEDYAIVEIQPVRLRNGRLATAGEIIEAHGAEIARILRGESEELSGEEAAHILKSRMSCHPTDLVVAGWAAALVCDTPSGAASALALLEQTNVQLLELKHYDGVLTRVLSDVYRSLEKRRGFLMRWKLAREAERLGTMRLDVRELTERIDNSNKFLYDSYSARLYRMAASRLGVPDYRKLVDDKLQIAAELHRFMTDRFHQGSAFVLELMIVIILIIDLAYLFWPRA